MRAFGQKICSILYQGIRELLSQRYAAYPAQLTLFLFLSILPLMTLLSELLGLFSLSLETVREWADLNLSRQGFDRLTVLLMPEKSSLAGNIFLFMTTLWSASKAQYAIISMTNEVMYGEQKKRKRYLKERLGSLLQLLVILLMIVTALAVLVYAPTLLREIVGEGSFIGFADRIWQRMRWIVVLLFYCALISLVYYVSMREMMSYRAVLPASLFAAVGFVVVTWAYMLFTSYSVRTNIIYGSLANVVFLLVWLWCISWVFCLGLVLTRAWQGAIEPETGTIRTMTVRQATDEIKGILLPRKAAGDPPEKQKNDE